MFIGKMGGVKNVNTQIFISGKSPGVAVVGRRWFAEGLLSRSVIPKAAASEHHGFRAVKTIVRQAVLPQVDYKYNAQAIVASPFCPTCPNSTLTSLTFTYVSHVKTVPWRDFPRPNLN